MEQKLACSCGKEYWPAQKWVHEKCKATNAVVNKGEIAVVNRQVIWQRENREKYNAKMREYMRKRRAVANQ